MDSLALLIKYMAVQHSFYYRPYGSKEELEWLVDHAHDWDVILWFPNIPNSEAKLVQRIKQVNKRVILVTSKNNLAGNYSPQQIIAHGLKNKANLMLELTKQDGQIAGQVLDPLGNAWSKKTLALIELAHAIISRVEDLARFTRVGSVRVTRSIVTPIGDFNIFFDAVNDYAQTFHDLIHAANADRLLGNMSFRCEAGFPSLKADNMVFVSRRNIDKRSIDIGGMVAISKHKINGLIGYYGEHKPSVDAPIQKSIYDQIPWARFMLHSHVYIEGAPMTGSAIPCGAFEEFEEIMYQYNKFAESHQGMNPQSFRINLRGHGSLAIGATQSDMLGIKYVARDFPEYQ
jgi:hypothetical protein